MKFITAIFPENLPHAEDLVKYYEKNIVRISDILERKIADIPRDISLCFVEVDEGEEEVGASYNIKEKRIIYKYRKGEGLCADKGRLIHEAAHVVLDYPDLRYGSALLCWAEGIADFCRLQLEPEFRTDSDLLCEPEKGSKYAAYFLEWLSKAKNRPSIVAELNQLIRDRGPSLNTHDHIFQELLQTNFYNLKGNYREDKYEAWVARTTHPSESAGPEG